MVCFLFEILLLTANGKATTFLLGVECVKFALHILRTGMETFPECPRLVPHIQAIENPKFSECPNFKMYIY